MLDACGKGAQWPSALHLFHCMATHRCYPDVVSYGATMRILPWLLALDLFEKMEEPDVGCYNTLLKLLASDWMRSLSLGE